MSAEERGDCCGAEFGENLGQVLGLGLGPETRLIIVWC